MSKTNFRISILAASVFVSACQTANQSAAVPTPTVTSSPAATPTMTTAAANNATDKWVGRWAGVEGTYLQLSKKDAGYVVEIADLDGPKTYEGVAAGDRIEFKRGGQTESIRAASGDETGMKYLAGKKNCLVVTIGSEGFCRD